MAEDIEVVAYFTVAEALTNAQKYANATHLTVSLAHRRDTLVLTIADDGVGGANETLGTGLQGLRHRIRSVDGTLSIVSPPGVGTKLYVALPARPPCQDRLN